MRKVISRQARLKDRHVRPGKTLGDGHLLSRRGPMLKDPVREVYESACFELVSRVHAAASPCNQTRNASTGGRFACRAG